MHACFGSMRKEFESLRPDHIVASRPAVRGGKVRPISGGGGGDNAFSWGDSSFGRTFAWQAKDGEFKPPSLRHCGEVRNPVGLISPLREFDSRPRNQLRAGIGPADFRARQVLWAAHQLAKLEGPDRAWCRAPFALVAQPAEAAAPEAV